MTIAGKLQSEQLSILGKSKLGHMENLFSGSITIVEINKDEKKPE